MKKALKYCLSTLKWLLIGTVGLILLAVFLFYLPPVQDFAVRKALDSVNAGGGMHISVKKARIGFPLRLSVDSLSMSTPGMEIAAARVRGDVAMLPLLRGSAEVKTLALAGAVVNLGTPDSALYMKSAIAVAALDNASVGLLTKKIDIERLRARNGRVTMVLKPDTAAVEKPAGEPVEWDINLHQTVLEGVYYRMQMLPTIDDLQCALPKAEMLDGSIDLKNSRINVDELIIGGVDARYIVPTSEYVKAHPAPVIPADTAAVKSAPWLINARKLRLTGSHAVYATAGAVPMSGFDPEYIEASEISISVDSFMNHGTAIRVPLTELKARERCGVSLSASGVFEMDSTAMYARRFSITTPASSIGLDAMMGLSAQNPPVKAALTVSLSPDDVKLLAPPAAQPIVAALPPYTPIEAEADIEGRMNNLEVRKLRAAIPRHVEVALQGNIADYNDINAARGDLRLTGHITDGNFIKPTLLAAKMQKQVNIPPLNLLGNVKLAGGIVDGDLRAVTHGGDVALSAWWNNRRVAYDVALDMNTFPIQSILPLSGLRDIDASVDVTGNGLDFFARSTKVDAAVNLKNMVINGRQYSDITLDAALADGHADVEAKSANPKADLNLTASGNLAGEVFNWTFAGDVRNIDLQALALSDTTAEGSVNLAGTASFRPAVAATRRAPGRPMAIAADVDVKTLAWRMPGMEIHADSLLVKFAADSSTSAQVTNHDLRLTLHSPQPLDTIMQRATWTSLALDRDIKRRRLAIDTIVRAMPRFDLTLDAGTRNVLADYLSQSDMSVKQLHLKAANDSVFSLGSQIIEFTTGKTRLDTIRLGMLQRGSYLLYGARIKNRPGTMDNFARVDVNGYVNADRVSLILKQQDIAGETGYSFGALASVKDSTRINLKFVPYHPIIGYKEWNVNIDNFIEYDLATHHIDANLNLHNDVSSLRLFTEHNHNDSTATAGGDDVILQLKDIKIADWLAINPFAPPVTGDVSADMRLSWHAPDLNGSGTVSLTDFNYGRRKVGDFELAVDLATNAAGTIRANTSLLVNGQKAMTAVGNLNDSTAANPFMLDFRMIHFPLTVLNPFLPEGTASLSGVLNGEMDITGDMGSPVFNGFLDFDSTKVNVEMLGTPFVFSEAKIPVADNLVQFNNFAIRGVNDKPLTINGTVDIASLASPRISLNMKARDMQIVGSKKQRYSQAYGKAFIDLDADIKGNLHFLDVDAALELLPGTNVTYVMAEAASKLQSRSNQDMVKFVNFNDTTSVLQADTVAPSAMLMDIDAKLTISSGTTVTVELDPSGNSKVQLKANGTVNYSQDYMADQRFTGRINLNGGFVRYAVPLIGEKSFDFLEGSYVEFNGDMLNPILNVQAADDVRANVSDESGNSRVVNFDVLLDVTGTLNEMNVAFDLSCNDDLTIANEIKSMTAEQRANQAMNLLLYGAYRSGGTQTITSGSMGTNTLYSFLQSQLNSWAASAIKGVDISFGINQYDKTVQGSNTTAMNYSYRVSKSLFDDRFKIVVGGNYSTDPDADENFAQNLIADISFEYMLNKAGTMYVRIFRHTGYESILEGEITQTGVGFVYRKKIQRIADIFGFMRRHHEESAPQASGSQVPDPASPQLPQPQPAVAPDVNTSKSDQNNENQK